MLRALACLLLIAAPAGASPRDDHVLVARLGAAFEFCGDKLQRYPSPRGYNPRREAFSLIRAAQRTPEADCPGIRAAAVAELRAIVGAPVRPDADLTAIALLARAADEGNGMASDPAEAKRLRWLLSLYDGEPHAGLPDDPVLRAPGTIALLEARVAAASTPRAAQLLAELRLRRDLPGYDPVRAIALLAEKGGWRGDVRFRLSGLLSDGGHVPPDYARAAGLHRYDATYEAKFTGRAQAEMLRIGKLALAAAVTPEDRLAVLHMLAPAALDGLADSRAAFAQALERAVPKVEQARLRSARAKQIYDALAEQLGHDLDWTFDGDPPGLRPIRLAGLIGPDGRLIATEVVASSGSAERDRDVQVVYLRDGVKLDLSDVAMGRFVRVALPQVDPYLTYGKVHDQWRRDREAAGPDKGH